MIRPNLFYFLSVPFFHSFSPLIRTGNLCQHIRSRAAPSCHEQTRHTDHTRRPLQAGEMGTPSLRSEQLRTHEQPRPRTTSGRTTSTASGRPMGAPLSPAGTPRALNETQGAHPDRNTITPPGVGISLLSRG